MLVLTFYIQKAKNKRLHYDHVRSAHALLVSIKLQPKYYNLL